MCCYASPSNESLFVLLPFDFIVYLILMVVDYYSGLTYEHLGFRQRTVNLFTSVSTMHINFMVTPITNDNGYICHTKDKGYVYVCDKVCMHMVPLPKDKTPWQVLRKMTHLGIKNRIKDEIKCIHVYGSPTES